MASKENSGNADEPAEVFRQFAWHLAGSLAGRPAGKGGAVRAPKPRPAATAKR